MQVPIVLPMLSLETADPFGSGFPAAAAAGLPPGLFAQLLAQETAMQVAAGLERPVLLMPDGAVVLEFDPATVPEGAVILGPSTTFFEVVTALPEATAPVEDDDASVKAESPSPAGDGAAIPLHAPPPLEARGHAEGAVADETLPVSDGYDPPPPRQAPPPVAASTRPPEPAASAAHPEGPGAEAPPIGVVVEPASADVPLEGRAGYTVVTAGREPSGITVVVEAQAQTRSATAEPRSESAHVVLPPRASGDGPAPAAPAYPSTAAMSVDGAPPAMGASAPSPVTGSSIQPPASDPPVTPPHHVAADTLQRVVDVTEPARTPVPAGNAPPPAVVASVTEHSVVETPDAAPYAAARDVSAEPVVARPETPASPGAPGIARVAVREEAAAVQAAASSEDAPVELGQESLRAVPPRGSVTHPVPAARIVEPSAIREPTGDPAPLLNQAQTTPAVETPKTEAAREAPPARWTPLTERPTLDTLSEYAVRSVRYMVTRGEKSLQVRLEPESLGRVSIEAVSSGGSLQVRLISSSAAVREQFESMADNLRQSLAREGFDAPRVVISSDAGSASSGQQAWRQPTLAGSPYRGTWQHPPPGSGREADAGAVASRAAPYHGRLNLYA